MDNALFVSAFCESAGFLSMSSDEFYQPIVRETDRMYLILIGRMG